MVNEFSDLSYACSENDLTPSGPSHSSITNQVCAVQGAGIRRGLHPRAIRFLSVAYVEECWHQRCLFRLFRAMHGVSQFWIVDLHYS